MDFAASTSVLNCWCERGDSNPYGFTRQILSSTRTNNQQFSGSCMGSYSLVKSLVSALIATSAPSASKSPLGTILGTLQSSGPVRLNSETCPPEPLPVEFATDLEARRPSHTARTLSE
jgi:hypothetical protein